LRESRSLKKLWGFLFLRIILFCEKVKRAKLLKALIITVRCMEATIRKLALMNALKYGGKAHPKAIIGKVIAAHPEAKNDMQGTMALITAVVEEVNALGREAQEQALLALDPDYFEKEREQRERRREERHQLPPLMNAEKGKVVTRIPPEPSKYNHVGHALSFLINYLYARMYDGKCILRFEDTNPEKERQEYVDAMTTDVLEYLDIKPDKVVFVSDHIDRYYEYAEQLIMRGEAYACFCSQEEIRKGRREMTPCPHRERGVKENLESWEKMKKGLFNEGECVLRLKIDMNHKNAVMRDPVIFRLCYTPHYRQGTRYKVWPLYDFENAVEEALCGVTHVLRSNEFASRIELQEYIRKLFSFPPVVTKQYGRFTITGATTKGREIRALIESGEYLGWDDPRLVTLRALKRRGIVKETYYELARIVGMSKKETRIDYSVLASINRRILDKRAKRFFLVEDPVVITVEGMPADLEEFVLSYHPDSQKGERRLRASKQLLIEKKDFSLIKKGVIVRLMDAMNIMLKEGTTFMFVSTSYDEYKNADNKGPIIHYLPLGEEREVRILMPDASVKVARAEKNVVVLEEGEVVQFERWGFCRLDDKETLTFWYTHD